MFTAFPTRNSQSKINFVKKTSDYAYPGTDGVVAYILTAGKGHIAVTSYGEVTGNIANIVGADVALTVQSDVGYDRTTYRKIVGFIDAAENQYGFVPTRSVSHYVMK